MARSGRMEAIRVRMSRERRREQFSWQCSRPRHPGYSPVGSAAYYALAQPLAKSQLVSCPVNNGAKSLDLPEDRIRGGGPEEGASVAIVVLHELIDLGHELRDA